MFGGAMTLLALKKVRPCLFKPQVDKSGRCSSPLELAVPTWKSMELAVPLLCTTLGSSFYAEMELFVCTTRSFADIVVLFFLFPFLLLL